MSGSIPDLTVCGIWEVVSCSVLHIKGRKVKGGHCPGCFFFWCLFCICHYESEEVEWKARLRKWFVSLTRWAFCTVSKPFLTVVLRLVLAEAQIDRPTKRVSGSVDLGWVGPKTAFLAIRYWCCWSGDLTLSTTDLNNSLLDISGCVITTRVSVEPPASPGVCVVVYMS